MWKYWIGKVYGGDIPLKNKKNLEVGGKRIKIYRQHKESPLKGQNFMGVKNQMKYISRLKIKNSLNFGLL